jgi:GNAT superfamily N-acetyltransferase
MTSITLAAVSFSDIGKFIDFPHDLYANDPNYVAELHIAMKDHMNPKRNPYFKHSEVEFILAYREDKIVGRIAVTINNNYNAFHNCNVGFFGFFDCINDQNVANQMLQYAENYCSTRNATQLLGPANFSTNDTATVLVDGFDGPPVVQMSYNFPYYKDLLEQAGFSKEMDMFAYLLKTDKVNDKSIQLASRLTDRLASRGIKIRNLVKKNWDKEINAIKEIYRSAWEKNWGFVPPTDEEFAFLAEGLKLLADERYIHIAEHNGKTVGFAAALPNINEITIKSRRGRLLPFTIFNLLFKKTKTKMVRVILLGVIEDYRKMGIEAVFFAKMIKTARENGLVAGEASWILENNVMMNQAAINLNGEPYRTYRIYSKSLK